MVYNIQCYIYISLNCGFITLKSDCGAQSHRSEDLEEEHRFYIISKFFEALDLCQV